MTRWRAVAGMAGPAAFVGAWLAAGALREGYDPVDQAISDLAREGAPTQPLMTAGFVAFGVLVPLWAPALARALEAPRVRVPVTVAGLATLAVAALPLTRDGEGLQDALHAVAAGTGYVAMALTPLVAAPALRRLGHRRAAAASVGTGVVSALALVGTFAAPEVSGALQRLGLTVVDAWHVAAAIAVVRGARAGS